MRRCPSEEGRAQFADAKGGPTRMLDQIAAQLASHRLPTVQHLIPVDETDQQYGYEDMGCHPKTRWRIV